jgi:uncharacterized cupredoxin-like copper-binding protein
MRRFRLRVTVPALGVCIAVGLFVALGAGSAPAALKGAAGVKSAATPNVTIISVTAGKPSELSFKVSKLSPLPAGKITFKVTNMGAAFHNFKICTAPVASAKAAAAKNSCVGKATPNLKQGESATLTVTLSKSGKYEFLCSVTGHAAAGMKGLLGVGTVVSASEQKAATAVDLSSNGAGAAAASPATASKTGAGGGAVGDPTGCPAGVTIKTSGNADADGDELGTEPDDNDGCV